MIHERIYLDENDDRVWLDTYIANDNGAPRPAMLVIPGGGYIGVSQFLEGEPIAVDFFQKGYNAFVLNYGVGKPTDVFPKHLIDAGRAMIYLRENAEALTIRADRIFAVGFSAGGHLCGCLATMFEYPEVKSAFGDKAEMIRPEGVILSYPVTVALKNAHQGSFRNLFGMPYEDIPEDRLAYVSLDLAVTEKSSPMYIWHTAGDKGVPPQGSVMLAMALKKKNVPFMLNIFPYGPHAIALGTKVTECGNPERIQPLAEGWTALAHTWLETLA